MEKIQMTISVTAQTAVKIAQLLAGNAEPTSQTIPAQPSAPINQPVPVNTAPGMLAMAAPVQTAPVQQQSAPVTAPANIAPVSQPCTYTIEQIQAACAPLMDAGKQQELVGLLAKFGVQSLPQLTNEQYGAFATELRGLGAKI